MIISQNTIQQILSRVDIIDIVGSFVKLKKRGTNYLGLCPFHNEKSPSFTVSPVKEIYKCFGCGRSGNSVSFLMEAEKYSYVEALRWLANKYGVEIEETETSPEYKQQQQVADSLYIINNFAQQFFSNYLLTTEEGRDIGLSYLKSRGFREDVIKKFQLGFNSEHKDGFTKVALAAKYNEELLVKTGLVSNREGNLYDNYRGRIIFPIHNQSGKVLGFGARIIKKNDKAPKYINTPENEIYVKSKVLYGSYFARQAIDKADECLLVEGYTDVVSLHQAGIENVVASGGTALTPDQLRLIKKYTNNLTIIYDGDGAGIKAALRGLDLALEEGLNVHLVLIPDGEDPDSYVNKIGATAFANFIASNKKDVILFQLNNALAEAGNDTNKKSIIINQIAETISKVNKLEDFSKQQAYIKQSAEILKIEEKGLHALINKFIRDSVIKEENKTEKRELLINNEIPEPQRNDFSNEAYSFLYQDQLQEKAITGVLLKYGDRRWDEHKNVAEYIISSTIDEDDNVVINEEDFYKSIDDIFDDKRVVDIFVLYRKWINNGKTPTLNDFTYNENSEMVQLAIETTNHPYELSPKWFEDEKKNAVIDRIQRLSYEDFMEQVVNNADNDQSVYLDYIDSNYKDEVEDVLIYLKLKKVKRLIIRNEKDYNSVTSNEDLSLVMKTHMHLKGIQKALGEKKQIVYYPF